MWRAVALALLSLPGTSFAVETVRIHMAEVGGELQIQGEQLGLGLDAEDSRFTPAAADSVRLRVAMGRIEVNGAPWPAEAIRFRAGEDGRDAGVPGGLPIRAGDFAVRGDVVVRVFRGKLQLINVIALEDYLAAVLGSEMPSSFPEEALKAQAVAARTYALQKKLEQVGEPYHLGSSVLSQVYGGLEHEDARTLAAVEATRGEVLTWELQPIEAYFHASCGGRTEDGLHALGRDLPYLQSVSCPCGALPASRWEATVPLREVDAALQVRGEAPLSIEGRTRTGRVTRVSAGSASLSAVRFREKLGYTRIKSLWFDVEPVRQGEALHFTGRGYGHGAGLCQWGAKVLASRGSNYREILAHYYPGTELQRLY